MWDESQLESNGNPTKHVYQTRHLENGKRLKVVNMWIEKQIITWDEISIIREWNI